MGKTNNNFNYETTALSRRIPSDDLFTSVDSIFDQMFRNMFPQSTRELGIDIKSASYPKCDIIEYSDSFSIVAEIPGLSKDDLSIKISDGYLKISGNKRSEENVEDSGGKYIRRELRKSAFSRSFMIDESALDVNSIKAEFSDGVVKVRIPKLKPQSKDGSREIEIKID